MGFDFNQIEKFAADLRYETLVELTHLGFGHVGGAMSIIETLSVLYGGEMAIKPSNPQWEDRDWLVCSKGHAGPSVYAALAMKGYFDKEMLLTLNQGGTNLPSHCDRNRTPGIDMTTGSLGQGISTALGVALGHKLDKRDNWVYLILGDGEINEGQVWEGALFANQFKVDNLITFVDYNGQQLDGYTKDIMDLGTVDEKFAAFGWHAQSIDGHDIKAIYQAIQNAKQTKGQPSVIVLNTKKGKGCSFAEGVLNNHHMAFTKEMGEEALKQAKAVCLALETKGA